MRASNPMMRSMGESRFIRTYVHVPLNACALIQFEHARAPWQQTLALACTRLTTFSTYNYYVYLFELPALVTTQDSQSQNHAAKVTS